MSVDQNMQVDCECTPVYIEYEPLFKHDCIGIHVQGTIYRKLSMYRKDIFRSKSEEEKR